MKLAKLNEEEYGKHCSSKMARLDINYSDLKNVLGEPFHRESENYPDDNYKTDVCWGIRSKDGGIITIWNYKNGPRYCGEDVPTLNDINHFSAWYTNTAFFNELLKELNN